MHVLLGDSISLVCGTCLDSNPQATITWTAPSGTTVAVMNNDRYHLENGSEMVRLNITNTVLDDSGIWRCDSTVSSGVSILSRGRLITESDTLIDSVSETIQVTITGEIYRQILYRLV